MASLISKISKWIPLGSVEEISVKEVYDLIQNNPETLQLLDVRSKPEWQSGHIPGAINVPITELASKAKQLPLDKNKLLVPICLSAHRSIPAVRVFKELGFSEVKQLAGGMKAWNKHYQSSLVKK